MFMNPQDPQQAATIWSILKLPTHWPAQTDLLQWAQNMSPGTATILLIGGMIYLLFGVYMFRALVMLNAAIVGAFIGALIGQGVSNETSTMAIGAGVGALLAAAITWPLMKYAVAFMGGVFGALLGASLWRAAGLEPTLCWAGALTGLIGFGLLSFILFRGSVMMYTSLQGSVMLVFGILGLIYKYQSIAPAVTDKMTLKPFLLPLLIFVPALLGVIYQQSQFTAPEPAGKKK
jgi:hypothetical protein